MREDGYPATLYSSNEPSGLPCRVHPRGDSLEAWSEGVVRISMPYSAMKVSVTGMEDRYLAFEVPAEGGSARLLVRDREIAVHMEALGATRLVLDQLAEAMKTRGRRKAGRLAALGIVAGLLLGAVLLVWAAFGWAVDAVVERIPPEWEVEIGRVTASQVLAENQSCSDPELDATIREIGRRLVVGMGTTPYNWKIRVLDNEEVNAFALPGGYVFVNRGLLERADTPHEVAGVLAHEVQHVLHRHGLKNLVRQIGLALIVYAAVGDSGQVQRFVALNAAELTSMSFSRDQETEADLSGMDLVYRAGFEPTGLMTFMKKLAAEEGALGSVTFLSTHPASSARADDLARTIRARGPARVVPFSVDWLSLRSRCAPVTVEDPDQI